MRFAFTLLLASLFLYSATQAQNTDGWIYKNEKDGVKVFYKATEDIHEVKLATALKTPLSGLIQLFSEVELYPNWGYKVIGVRNNLREIHLKFISVNGDISCCARTPLIQKECEQISGIDPCGFKVYRFCRD